MKKQKMLSLILMVFLPIILMAHPPKKVDVKYKKESNKLIISIPHLVKNVEKHYIESIIISVDGKEIKVLEYTSQSTKESHDIEIELPELESGNEVEVKAKCNKMGTKVTTIKIL
ncbi:MAG: hypothetical protein KAT68_06875 [Bacteroidales bacterium]|nr:hypothetical protein [Bacteroidales bacterium]